MKVTQIFGIILIFAALVAVFLLSGVNQPVLSASNTSPLSQTLPTASPPIPDGVSVIGSTDGILIMGFVIMLIILVPVIIYSRRKK